MLTIENPPKPERPIYVYACLVDFDYHLEDDPAGTIFYPTLADLKRNCKCVKGCGIVRVKCVLDKVIQKERLPKC